MPTGGSIRGGSGIAARNHGGPRGPPSKNKRDPQVQQGGNEGDPRAHQGPWNLCPKRMTVLTTLLLLESPVTYNGKGDGKKSN